MAQGNHARPFGINFEGLKRRGFDKPTMHAIRKVYKLIYSSGKTLEECLVEIEQIAATELRLLFLNNSSNVLTRGIIR
ncbi:Acyl-[acyl-carrier-protein]--UDP-N-acetylglucosamine O-acyltransferase [Mannheimia haemolytica]|nr:Acyl-[acyl-carrier-protein]--UDP-N-acetylglucosamine O-acyltransferase [Mannheimia haemolytica]